MREEILILDKSAFEAMSKAEHTSLMFRYMQNVTPVLGMEILCDLVKEHDTSVAAPEWVKILAKKFGGSGDPVNMDFIHLVAGELAGNPVPMTRQIIPDNSWAGPGSDGAPVMMVDLGPFNHAFMRWAAGKFSQHDRHLAQTWRENPPRINHEALWQSLKDRDVLQKRPRQAEDVVGMVDQTLDVPSLQALWLDYMLGYIDATERFRPIVYDRWLRHGSGSFRTFSPYSAHCLRVILATLVLTKHALVVQKATNFVDAQYLYYLPFCDIFVSGDKLHRCLVPSLLQPGQRFLAATDLKTELKKLVGRRRAKPSTK